MQFFFSKVLCTISQEAGTSCSAKASAPGKDGTNPIHQGQVAAVFMGIHSFTKSFSTIFIIVVNSKILAASSFGGITWIYRLGFLGSILLEQKARPKHDSRFQFLFPNIFVPNWVLFEQLNPASIPWNRSSVQ